jgi:hypothetical protein
MAMTTMKTIMKNYRLNKKGGTKIFVLKKKSTGKK